MHVRPSSASCPDFYLRRGVFRKEPQRANCPFRPEPCHWGLTLSNTGMQLVCDYLGLLYPAFNGHGFGNDPQLGANRSQGI